ncbi:MFS transporter [Streptacidiphilus sp. N1-12]|uniref:MFS transporter n=2 Tax=Streptacidiphilus alkalitolerans TaxID=3342712 RepID=A0ABV6VE46_9ACTN
MRPEPSVTAPRSTGLVLALLGVFLMVVMMDNTIVNIALRAIQEQLDASNSQLQWAVDSYILIYAALMFPAGILADRYGRKRVLLIGLTVFAAASALSAFSHTPDQLIVWRAVMGLGGAVVPPATLSIIRDTFPSDQQGRAMGIWSAIGGSSVAFGPLVGGLLLERFWWGSVFLINVPIVLLAGALAMWAVPESRAATSRRLDLPGVVLSVAGATTLVFGVIRGGETTWRAWNTTGLVAAGLVILALFVLVERRRAEPTIDVSLFRNRAFASGTLSMALAFFAITGGTYLLVFYSLLVRGDSTLQFGLVLLPVAVGSIPAALAANALTRARGPRFTVLLGLGSLTAAFVILYFLEPHTPLLVIEGALLLAGLGIGSVMATTTPLVMAVVEPQKAAAGAAANSAIRQIGGALGVAVLGSVYATRYHSGVTGTLAPWTPPLPEQAQDSLGATATALESAARSGNPGLVRAVPQLQDGATHAFINALRSTSSVTVAVLLAGMVLGAFWLPARTGGDTGRTATGSRPGLPLQEARDTASADREGDRDRDRGRTP